MKASGASEDETEKTQLLDDLLLRMQETEEKSVKASIAASAANRSKDLNAHHVRHEAMKTIGKRKVEELGPSKSTPSKKQQQWQLVNSIDTATTFPTALSIIFCCGLKVVNAHSVFVS
ncbi:hypothetical protein H257_14852 [Aphanomyces astaci]|uniref:Uncharacterized protein n=1 Tax=Aphanomyces astaci TaxID=112090 RepID=W4FPR8_APHAT|nr:hypothetical protein H257_14852 [Aphanomyces astaci]ETV69482.1 hypothetical protein H257_14852 [Aphanomyces astaci]|eukprot:XP_009841055.1 hypothetical protein H257_14852 [Aphanomyces astaci]